LSAVLTEPPATESGGFHLHLDNFDGPFDLLLQLIAKHKLDVTEVALSQVTDEFIAHIKEGGAVWDLEQTSSFLVVAATLLDLKAARLIPSGEVEDVEDLALLEARDLLFSRLLQYRAFKQVADWLGERWETESKVLPRPGGMPEPYASMLPEVEISGGVNRLAKLLTALLSAPDAPEIPVEHLHIAMVTVTEQAGIIVDRLQDAGTLTFAQLTADADRLTTVVRFLALLELFRNRAIALDQNSPLGELTVTWTGEADTDLVISDEFDNPDATAPSMTSAETVATAAEDED
jgi:segregation and condensation protein A